MANTNMLNIILTAASACIGFLLLIASSLLLDEFREFHKTCHDSLLKVDCEILDGTVAAASVGIIAAIIQMVFCVIALIKRGDGMISKMWPIAHIAVLVIALIAFAVGIHYQEKDLMKEFLKVWSEIKTKYQFFNGMAGLDWIFCLIASILSFVLSKK